MSYDISPTTFQRPKLECWVHLHFRSRPEELLNSLNEAYRDGYVTDEELKDCKHAISKDWNLISHLPCHKLTYRISSQYVSCLG